MVQTVYRVLLPVLPTLAVAVVARALRLVRWRVAVVLLLMPPYFQVTEPDVVAALLQREVNDLVVILLVLVLAKTIGVPLVPLPLPLPRALLTWVLPLLGALFPLATVPVAVPLEVVVLRLRLLMTQLLAVLPDVSLH